MTIEEYSALIATATAENFQSVMTDVMKEIKSDFSTIENYKNQISDQETKIRDLQDTNQKLFLSQTSTIQHEKEDPAEGLEGIPALDAISKQIKEEAGEKTGFDILK